MLMKPPKGAMLERGHPLSKGLVGCWLMNEGGGNILNDASGNRQTLTRTGGVTWQGGKSGPAIATPGGAHYYSGPTSSLVQSITGGWTIMARVKPAVLSGYQCIVQAGAASTNRIGLWVNADEVTVCSGNNYNSTASVNLLTGVWYDIVVTKYADAAGAPVYINGIFRETTGTVAQALGPSGNWQVFYSVIQSGYSFTGSVECIFCWNRSLSPSEIGWLYREPFAMFQREPIELWTGAVSGAVEEPLEIYVYDTE